MIREIRYAIRQLAKHPGFTVVSALTLGLGIGANTAIFSVVNALLLRPLPYPHSERLVLLRERSEVFDSGAVSYPNYLDWRAAQRGLPIWRCFGAIAPIFLPKRAKPIQNESAPRA